MDYTPTTEEVRAAAITDYREEEITPQQFDRWLAEVKAQAWEEGYESGFDKGFASGDGLPDNEPTPANPYRQGEN